jgi:hypothetical protein
VDMKVGGYGSCPGRVEIRAKPAVKFKDGGVKVAQAPNLLRLLPRCASSNTARRFKRRSLRRPDLLYFLSTVSDVQDPLDSLPYSRVVPEPIIYLLCTSPCTVPVFGGNHTQEASKVNPRAHL